MNPNTAPRVTIAMPVFNAGKYLRSAVESILSQSYKDFILLVINDGSSDDSDEVMRSFSDPRIEYHRNDTNIGLVKTLNKAIMLTRTEYFARMDADDIALPERLQVQLNFMDQNPAIGVCGSLYEIFGDESFRPQLPLSDEEIKAQLLFGNTFCHPTVLLRTRLLKENDFLFGAP